MVEKKTRKFQFNTGENKFVFGVTLIMVAIANTKKKMKNLD